MVSLGEMSAYIPHKRGFAGYASRFVDPAVGFALGYNYLMKYLVVTPNNISAACAVLQYWKGGRDVHIGVWITVFIAFSQFYLASQSSIDNSSSRPLPSFPHQSSWCAGIR